MLCVQPLLRGKVRMCAAAYLRSGFFTCLLPTLVNDPLARAIGRRALTVKESSLGFLGCVSS